MGHGATHVDRLNRQTAASQRLLLGLNMACNLLLAGSEALTFAVIFRAASLLNAQSESSQSRCSDLLAPAGALLDSLSRAQQFLLLLLLAVFLQAITSLARYGNGLAAGWFAARCQGRILPILHRHLVSFSYSCASRFRIGHLANVVGRAPLTVQIQIMEREQLLSNGLLMLVYLVILFSLNPWLSLVSVKPASLTWSATYPPTSLCCRSPIGSAPSGMPTRSSCSRQAGWWRGEVTLS